MTKRNYILVFAGFIEIYCATSIIAGFLFVKSLCPSHLYDKILNHKGHKAHEEKDQIVTGAIYTFSVKHARQSRAEK